MVWEDIAILVASTPCQQISGTLSVHGLAQRVQFPEHEVRLHTRYAMRPASECMISHSGPASGSHIDLQRKSCRYGLIKLELQEAELEAAGSYVASVAIGEQV